jgi:ferric-dicitrate binding protein FerR (iron transport regulator)
MPSPFAQHQDAPEPEHTAPSQAPSIAEARPSAERKRDLGVAFAAVAAVLVLTGAWLTALFGWADQLISSVF